MEDIWNSGAPYKPYRGRANHYALRLPFPSQFDNKQQQKWPQIATQLAYLAILTRMDSLFNTSSLTQVLSAANLDNTKVAVHRLSCLL